MNIIRLLRFSRDSYRTLGVITYRCRFVCFSAEHPRNSGQVDPLIPPKLYEIIRDRNNLNPRESNLSILEPETNEKRDMIMDGSEYLTPGTICVGMNIRESGDGVFHMARAYHRLNKIIIANQSFLIIKEANLF